MGCRFGLGGFGARSGTGMIVRLKNPTAKEIAARRRCAVSNLTSALEVLDKATCQATMAWREFQRTEVLLKALAKNARRK